MAGQRVRPSQFITTYGPGAILETATGPVVIPSMSSIFNSLRLNVQDYEIADDRLSRMELGGAGILRLPTNAELRTPEEEPIYWTERFPFWCLCINHQPGDILYRADTGCPRCPQAVAHARRQKAGKEAIRFVLICPHGHLDDIDWNRLVHGNAGGCAPDHYVWRGGGGALRNMSISCPDCPATASFGVAYGRPWRCSARYAEDGARPPQSTCGEDARIVQRGAANVRVARVVSALTILDMPSRLYNVLQDGRILGVASGLQTANVLIESVFRQAVGSLGLPQPTLDVLTATPWSELEPAIRQILGLTATPRPIKVEEFDRLRRAASVGAPPGPPPRPGVPPAFEVRLSEVKHFAGPAGQVRFRVAPVNRLRIVMVQKEYFRLDPDGGRARSVEFRVSDRPYYPGVELFGEGIFLDLDGVDLGLAGERWQAWMNSHQTDSTVLTTHPVHVWWHTLAHRLLRSLAVDSGYSSASIRERVYLEVGANGQAHGGLLLYTAQPGGDGTLGGLVALVPDFGRVLTAALADLANCSNDPLCEETVPNGVNGAACYACLFGSETSCDHRNMHLDRGLLLQNLP